jgi:hypothetical protein
MSGNGYMKAYHCVLDEANRELKAGKFQIFYYIYRQTIGWNRYVAKIALKQFEVELPFSCQGLLNILEELNDEQWIHIIKDKTKGGRPFYSYSLGERVYHSKKLSDITQKSLLKKVERYHSKKLSDITQKSLVEIINKDNSKDINKDKIEKPFWNFSDVIYDRERPPEKMWALQTKLNEGIYDMSNLWCEEHFDCLRFLMENCMFEEIYELGEKARANGIECNAALFWMVAMVKGEDYNG